jgi:uncharacterized protein (TIGR02594 family)
MNYVVTHPEIFAHAMSFYGLEEISGEKHNPKIIEFFKEIGHSWVQTDETAWCSAFINYLAKKNGYEYSGHLDARSWQKVGASVYPPNVGDLVVLWRESPDSWKGHVGLYVRKDQNKIWVLGGNQSGAVNIKPYPVERLLSYRTLRRI